MHIPKTAIILAAGKGERMKPLTDTTPKPLIPVFGKPIIETIIEDLKAVGVKDIVIVVGYLKEQFDYLVSKYDVQLIENEDYENYNNVISLLKAINYVDDCYICEADLILNKNVFSEVDGESFYFGVYKTETSDWCAELDYDDSIERLVLGGKYAYQTCGISYWSPIACKILRDNIEELCKTEVGKHMLWDMAVFDMKNRIRCKVKALKDNDIIEVDSVEELAKVDELYKKFV